jgi:CRISPR-associated protein Cas1
MINLHVTSKGTSISLKNDIICIESNEKWYEYSIGYVQYIFIHADITINSDVIRKAFDRGIEIIFCREVGHQICSLYGPMYGARAGLCFKQLQMVQTEMARSMAAGWILMKYTERLKVLNAFSESKKDSKLTDFIQKTEMFISSKPDTRTVFAQEAVLDKSYYSMLNHILPKTYYFKRSEKRNGVWLGNAVLNYLYGMMYITVERLILKNRLDPYIGFHHGMAKGKKAFLFDTIEPYRPYCEKIMLHIARLNPDESGILGTALLPLELRKKLITTFNNELYHDKAPLIKKMDKDFKNIAQNIKSGTL